MTALGAFAAGAPGIGIDLLEIERLEHALERRPRLADRLFTDAEREYAAARGRPGQHLAARFCAKEAVAKALGLEAWSFRDVEVLGRDGPAGDPPARGRGRPGGGARRAGQGVADPRAARRGGRRDRAVTLPGWLTPLPGAEEQRATRRVGDPRAGDPGPRADGARGRGPDRAGLRAGSPGTDRGRLRQGQQRRRRLRGRAAAAPAWLRGRRAPARVAPTSSSGDAAANCERLPGAPPRQFEAGALDGSAAIVDAILGTGFSGAPREPAAGAISAINEAGRRGAVVVACDVPSGVDASTGEVAGEAVRAARHRRRSTRPSPASGSPPERRTPARCE